MNTSRSGLGRIARTIYHRLPLSAHDKWRLKSVLYRLLGPLIRDTASYRHWLGQQQAPSKPAVPEPRVRPLDMIWSRGLAPAELLRDLSIPTSATPAVSVVIPVYNQIRYTAACLASIAACPPQVPFEVIVLDDASDDGTADLIATLKCVRHVRNPSNVGFLRSVNMGLVHCRGRYLMLLNNDTEVQPGWLDTLVAVFDQHPDAGMVGSRLLYPSGHLQEAGAVLRRDGSVDLVGLNEDPSLTRFNHLREVDHCSGASVLIDLELLRSLGGFDERYAPCYYEDCDLSLRVRGAGRRVFVQPASSVIHHLSVTTGQVDGAKMAQIDRNRALFLERWQPELEALDTVRLVAFYLPQYHPIPENDQWWGKGFTEWTNVTKARPNFEGHYQPHLPADLGFYDLRVPEVREEQARMARAFGIYGFCYYHYWFGGRRLLQRPLDEVLASGRPDFPFCVCWANENWSRRWDGRDSEILIAQQHSDADDLAFIRNLIPALEDPRYIRIGRRPLLLVYRIGLLPNPARTAEIWREECARRGVGEIYLAAVHSFGATEDPRLAGFDGAVEFPPHEMGVVMDPPVSITNAEFRGMFYDYAATASKFIERPPMPYPFFRTVMPAWDNTARRQDTGDIFLNGGPEHYERWLASIVRETRQLRAPDDRVVFVNAWNEWAEGNHLEPDRRYGHAYLECTRRALAGMAPSEPGTRRERATAPARLAVS